MSDITATRPADTAAPEEPSAAPVKPAATAGTDKPTALGVASEIETATKNLDAFSKSYDKEVEGKAGIQKAMDFGRKAFNGGYGDDQLKNIGQTREDLSELHEKLALGQIDAAGAAKELKSINSRFSAEASRVTDAQAHNAKVGEVVHGTGRVAVVTLTGLAATGASGGNVFVGYAAAVGAGSVYDAATVADQGKGKIAPKLDGDKSIGGVAVSALKGEEKTAADWIKGSVGSVADGVNGAFAGQGMVSSKVAQLTVQQAAAQGGGQATQMALGTAAAKAGTLTSVAQTGANFGVSSVGTALDPTLTRTQKEQAIGQNAVETVKHMPADLVIGAASSHLGVSGQLNNKALDAVAQTAMEATTNVGQASVDNAIDGKGFGVSNLDLVAAALQTAPGTVQNLAQRAPAQTKEGIGETVWLSDNENSNAVSKGRSTNPLAQQIQDQNTSRQRLGAEQNSAQSSSPSAFNANSIQSTTFYQIESRAFVPDIQNSLASAGGNQGNSVDLSHLSIDSARQYARQAFSNETFTWVNQTDGVAISLPGEAQKALPPASDRSLSDVNQPLLSAGEEHRTNTAGRRSTDRLGEVSYTKTVVSGERTAELTVYPPGTMSEAESTNLAATVIGGNNRSYSGTNSQQLGRVMDRTHVLSLKPSNDPDQKFGAVSTITFDSARAIDSGLPLNSAYWGQVVGGAKDPNFFYDPNRRARAEQAAVDRDPTAPLEPLPPNSTPLGRGELNMSTGGAIAYMLPEAISMSKENGQDRLFFYTTDPENIEKYSIVAQGQLDAGNVTDWRMTIRTESDGKQGYNYELYLNEDTAPPGSLKPADSSALPPASSGRILITDPPRQFGEDAGGGIGGSAGAMHADYVPPYPEGYDNAVDLSHMPYDSATQFVTQAPTSQAFRWNDPETDTDYLMRGEVEEQKRLSPAREPIGYLMPGAEPQGGDLDTASFTLDRSTMTPGQAPRIEGTGDGTRSRRGEGLPPTYVPDGVEGQFSGVTYSGLAPADLANGTIQPVADPSFFQNVESGLQSYDQFNDASMKTLNPRNWFARGNETGMTREELVVQSGGLPPQPEPSMLRKSADAITGAYNEVTGIIPQTYSETETPQQKALIDGTAAITTPITNAIQTAQGAVFNKTTQRLAVAATQLGALNFAGNVAAGNYSVYANAKNSDVPEISRIMNLPPDGNFTGVTLDKENPADNFIGAGYRFPSDITDVSVRGSTIDRFQASSGGTPNPAYMRTNLARLSEGTVGFNFGDDNLGVRGLFNVTVGGAAANNPYLTTGNISPDQRVPALGVAHSIAPVQTTAVFGGVVGPVMPSARVAAGQSGEVGTIRSTSGANVVLGNYQFPSNGPGPAVLTNPAWKGSEGAAMLDNFLDADKNEPFRFPVDDQAIDGIFRPKLEQTQDQGLNRPAMQPERDLPQQSAIERRQNSEAVYEDGDLQSFRIGDVEIPAHYLNGRPIEVLQQAQSPALEPNAGDSVKAARNDDLQLLFGQSPWDIGFSGIKRDARGSMELRDGTVDVLNHGNPVSALTEPVYELGVQYNTLEPGQRIENNEHAGLIIDQTLERALQIDRTLQARGEQSDEYASAVDRLRNPYDIDFGSAHLRSAQSRSDDFGVSQRPSNYELIRSIYEGRLR